MTLFHIYNNYTFFLLLGHWVFSLGHAFPNSGSLGTDSETQLRNWFMIIYVYILHDFLVKSAYHIINHDSQGQMSL